MKHPEQSWQKLAAAARLAPATADVAAPYGFSTRVAALALEGGRRPASVFEHIFLRVSLGALGASCLLALVAGGLSYPTAVRMFTDSASTPVAVSAEAAAPAAPAYDTVPAAAAPDAAESPASPEDSVAEVVDLVS
ncbi:MAG TPA: hypothetical protein VHV47_08810 [Opitutaceae bacterium]|jgi:hypothetical protein|nr:hypothetical protein [Opitutaceae bacterium]